jgi:hypothetical protein
MLPMMVKVFSASVANPAMFCFIFHMTLADSAEFGQLSEINISDRSRPLNRNVFFCWINVSGPKTKNER